jgi:hypothetical protein
MFNQQQSEKPSCGAWGAPQYLFCPSLSWGPRTAPLPASRNAGKGREYWMGRLSPCPHLNPETGAVGSLRPRLPRPCRPSTKHFVCRFRLACQFLVCEPPSDDLRKCQSEAPTVIVLALVVAKRLLVQIAEQVERLDADVGSFQAALQQRPEILDSVRVDVAVDVSFRRGRSPDGRNRHPAHYTSATHR